MHKHRLLILVISVMFILTGYEKGNDQIFTFFLNEEQTADNSSRGNSETPLLDSSSEDSPVTASSASDTDKNVETDDLLFLCAWQNQDYIDYGLPSHYMIYYIERDGSSYSAFWETEDKSPDEAANHFAEFTDNRSLGMADTIVTSDLYSKFLDFSDQELTREETEQLDVSSPAIWWFGYFNTDEGETVQKFFYYAGDCRKIIDNDDTRYVVNELYIEPTFETARNIWTTVYYK